MQRTLNWAEEIGVIAGPLKPGDTRESWLARAARKAGLSYRQCKSLFYGQTKDPRHSIASKLLSAADRARLEEARRNVANAETICREHIARLESNNPDFHREQINALRTSLHLIGAGNRAGT